MKLPNRCACGTDLTQKDSVRKVVKEDRPGRILPDGTFMPCRTGGTVQYRYTCVRCHRRIDRPAGE